MKNAPRKILVIDDEAEIGWLLEKLFQEVGYPVIHRLTGQDGLDTLLSDPSISLTLLDLKLPDIHGLEVLRRIRESSNNSKVAIITAYGDEEARNVAKTLGACAFFDKPLNLEELVKLVQEQLVK